MAIEYAKIKELREERRKLAEDAGKLLQSAKKEERDLSGEEREQFDNMHADADKLLETIETEERQWQLEQSLGNVPEQGVAGREDTDDRGNTPAAEKRKQENGKLSDEEMDKLELRSWVGDGFGSMPTELRDRAMQRSTGAPSNEIRALTSTTGSSGEYTIPTGFRRVLETALKAYWVLDPSVVNVMTTESGNPLPMPTATDTGNKGVQLGENTQIASDTDPTFGQVSLGAYMYSSKIVKVPIQLTQDSAFDLTTWLSSQLAVRIGRILADKMTTGAGSTEPTGIVTAATAGNTAANAATVSYAELITLEHKVDPAYRDNAKYMFHDSTLEVLRKLTDGDGRPLWQASIAIGQPDTLNGHPYIVNQSMPTMATGNKTVLFGDLSKYMVRRVRDVQMVRFGEKYMDYLQIGVMAFLRADGNLLDAGTHPVAYLTQA